MANDNKLLSPLSDIVFKALFGKEENSSKIILIDFLNSILNLKHNKKIKEITHLNPFNLQNFKGDKESILDLKVKTETGERINIEVQVNKEDDFRKRSLYYWAKMYAETISEADAYITLKKSIVINITDFEIIEETKKYHTEYIILEKGEHFTLIDDLSIHYIELPKFDLDKDIEHMAANELWLTFMKNAGKPETEDLIKKLIKRSEILKMTKEMLEQISADEKMRQEYYAREKARLDAISKRKYAEIMTKRRIQEGIEKGVKEGVEKGMKKIMEQGIEKGMEKGMQQGMQQGMEKGKGRGKVELLMRLLKKKFNDVPDAYEIRLQDAKEDIIDKIAEDIFDIAKIEDLDRYF